MRTLRARIIYCSLVALAPTLIAAQASRPPLEFNEYEGTWTLDETNYLATLANQPRRSTLVYRRTAG